MLNNECEKNIRITKPVKELFYRFFYGIKSSEARL
jgi:hypothetical protein